MKPSEKAKKLGFKSLKQVAKILGVTEQTVINKSKQEDFDDVLIGAKHKLSMAEIEFYKECADRSGITFQEWFDRKDEI